MKTTNLFKAALTLTVAGTMFFGTVTAQPLQEVKMSMQGILKIYDGTIVGNGSYDVTFRIYDANVNGNVLWTEAQTIQTNGGVYNTVLGKSSAGLTALQALKFDVPYYLGITIAGSQEMNPRMELTGSPFSIRARLADEATHALKADLATAAIDATHANVADLATNATNAANATNAGYATVAGALSSGAGQSIDGDFVLGTIGGTDGSHHDLEFSPDGGGTGIQLDYWSGGLNFGDLNGTQALFTLLDNGSLLFKNDVWHKSLDSKNRFHFAANGTTYFGSQNGYVFKNSADNFEILSLTNAGDLNFIGNANTTTISFNNFNYKSYITNGQNLLKFNAYGDVGIFGTMIFQTNSIDRVKLYNASEIGGGSPTMEVFGKLNV